MISRLLGPVGLGMCPPLEGPPPSHIHLHHWISKTDDAQEEGRAIFFSASPPPTKTHYGTQWERNEIIRAFFLRKICKMKLRRQRARCCREHDRLVPLATHAEVMKPGNLTRESPSSAGADEALNALGQLVTQPIPGAQAGSEGVLGQGSAGGRLRGWDCFNTFWETLKGQIDQWNHTKNTETSEEGKKT